MQGVTFARSINEAFFEACEAVQVESDAGSYLGAARDIPKIRHSLIRMLRTANNAEKSFLMCVDPAVLYEVIHEISNQNDADTKIMKLQHLYGLMAMLENKTVRDEKGEVTSVFFGIGEELQFSPGRS